jgi:glycosyltransferase involved in cell wall biosynthesis
LIALVHHPLALETGLAAEVARTLRESETRALSHARHVVVTSRFTARLLVADYGAPAHRMSVAPPGTDRVVPARAPRSGALALLAVGAVTRRKGYDVLIAALAALTDLDWSLTIVGDLTRDAGAAAGLFGDIARHDLQRRVTVAGAVDGERLAKLYANADLFALASRFEGYGMAFADALAHGLPVVGTTAGAIPTTVPMTAAVLAAPDDVDGFAEALRRVIADPAERWRLAAGARAAGDALPTWEQSSRLFAEALEAAA